MYKKPVWTRRRRKKFCLGEFTILCFEAYFYVDDSGVGQSMEDEDKFVSILNNDVKDRYPADYNFQMIAKDPPEQSQVAFYLEQDPSRDPHDIVLDENMKQQVLHDILQHPKILGLVSCTPVLDFFYFFDRDLYASEDNSQEQLRRYSGKLKFLLNRKRAYFSYLREQGKQAQS